MLFMPNIRNLLNGSFSFEGEDRLLELKIVYINFTLLFAAISSPIIGLLHLSHWGEYTSTVHGINCLLFSLFAISLIFYLRRSLDHYALTAQLILVAIFLIFISNLIFSVNENMRLIWFVLFIMISQELGGNRVRNVSILATSVILTLYYWLPNFNANLSITDLFSSILLLTLSILLFSHHDVAIRRVVEQLDMAKKEAQHMAEAKSQFLSSMSHEIRTPLSGMLGFTEILLKDESEPERVKQLTNIRTSGNLLKGLINNILDMSKIDHEKMSIENRCFSLRNELMVMALFDVTAANSRIKYTFKIAPDVPEYVVGDSLRLTQVLNNLVGNALKFTPEGGAVSLKISVTDDGKSLHFEVRDSGIGISKEEQKIIFSPFTQSDESIGRKYGGTGLGLSISQKLLGLMGSTLELESGKGAGSCFFFELPFPACQQCDMDTFKAIVNEPIVSDQCLKILLVEDDKINQAMLMALLKRLGHSVTLVDDGHKVLGAFDKDNFDMVLMDIRMPVMGGVEATRLLRNHGITTPIIALSANVFKDDIEHYLSSGMDECLSKPVDIEKLEQLITRYAVAT